MFIHRGIAVVLLVAMVQSSGCTSMKTIVPATKAGPAAPNSLKVGDTVIVETRDRGRSRFVVQELTDDAIIARGGQRFERADIVKVQRKSFSIVKTVTLVAVLGFGVVVMYGVALVTAADDLLSGRLELNGR